MTDVSFVMRKRTKLYRQVGNLGLCSRRYNELPLAVLLRAVALRCWLGHWHSCGWRPSCAG